MNSPRLHALAIYLAIYALSALAPCATALAEQPTEVVIVSTQHFITDMPDGYTPAHLRALLEKAAPAVLAVEACSNADDPWLTAPYELTKVTRPWAIERKVPLVPIGWSEPNYSNQLGVMFNKFVASGNAAAYEQAEQQFQKQSAELTMTCASMNDDRSLNLWRNYHAKLHELYGEETPWEAWNDKITANLLALCRKHPAKRIAVVFGGAHAYYFADRLAKEPNIRVIAAKEFFPLADDEIAAATRDGDYLQAMRLLNYFPGSLTPAQLTSLEQRLQPLQDFKQYQNDYQYYKARLLLHQNKPADALEALTPLADVQPSVLLDFDGVTSVRDAARLQIYFAIQGQGKTTAAIEHLRSLANDKTVSLSIRQTAEALLNANATPATNR